MSNERPNEFLSWRGQLSGPDALPEQGVDDKELTWQRLAERLQKQPRRRGIAWWIAAACLILAFFLPATHLFRARPTRPNRIVLRPRAQREPATAASSHPAPATSAQSTASDNPQPISHSNRGEIAPVKNIPPTNTLPATQTIAITPPVIPPDTVLAFINPPPPPPPPRKPLRIVYLNELNKDPGPSTVLSSRQAAFVRLSTATAGDRSIKQNVTPIIKIEISSPNH
jgi:hypothetical protein